VWYDLRRLVRVMTRRIMLDYASYRPAIITVLMEDKFWDMDRAMSDTDKLPEIMMVILSNKIKFKGYSEFHDEIGYRLQRLAPNSRSEVFESLAQHSLVEDFREWPTIDVRLLERTPPDGNSLLWPRYELKHYSQVDQTTPDIPPEQRKSTKRTGNIRRWSFRSLRSRSLQSLLKLL
jgi:hypothetical protein